MIAAPERQTTSKNRLSEPAIAMALATLCCVLWGSAYPGVKLGYESLGIGSGDTAEKLLYAGLRFSFAGLAVLALGFFKSLASGVKTPRMSGGDRLRVAALGLAQTSVQYVFFYIGLSNTSGAKGAIINSVGVFFSAILAHLLYSDDKLGIRKVAGIAIGFAGVIAVNLGGQGMGGAFRIDGEGFIALAALTLASASLYGKRLTRRLDPVPVTGGQLLFGGLALCLAGILGGARAFAFTPASAAILAYLVMLSAVAFTLWTALLAHNKVSTITVFNFVIPVAGTLLSALFLGDSIFEPKYAIALPTVALGVILVNGTDGLKLGSRKRREETAS